MINTLSVAEHIKAAYYKQNIMLTLMNTLSINIEIIIPSAIQNMINPIILHIMRSIPYQALTVANGYYLYTSDIII